VILINDINFNDNTNTNKYECGSIHFCNDINVSIQNSKFNNNNCKNNGGAM